MDSNVLTVLAILIAGYTLLIEEKRIDLVLRLSWISLSFLVFLVLSLAYFIYLPVLLALGIALPLPWVAGFDANLATFTTIIIILVCLAIKLAGHHLPKSRIHRWKAISEKLVRTQKFEQLAFLLEKYHLQFITANEPRWYDSTRLKLMAPHDTSPLNFLEQDESFKTVDSRWGKFTAWVVRKCYPIAKLISKLLPDDTTYRSELTDSISHLLKSQQFVQHISQNHPLMCARFTTFDFATCSEYSAAFLREQISNTNSPLYRELRYNQTCSHTGEQYVEPTNVLLDFYFSNIQIAYDVHIWRPIGDYAKEYVAKQKGPNNFYNQPYQYTYDDKEKWSCPIFMTLHFFNIMVSRTIFDEYQEHMWLMYVRYIFDEILENYDPQALVDFENEFPTRFDYLMYEALDTCAKWVRSIQYTSTPKELSKATASVPELSAAKTLGEMLRSIVKTDKLKKKQIVYYVQEVVRVLNALDETDKRFFSRQVINSTINKSNSKPDEEIVSALYFYYQDIDHVHKKDNSTINNILKRKK